MKVYSLDPVSGDCLFVNSFSLERQIKDTLYLREEFMASGG